MVSKRNPKLHTVEKHLQQQFDLDFADAEVLTGDLLVNIETLKKDLAAGVADKDWKLVRDAAGALHALATNLQQQDLMRIGEALVAAAKAKKTNIDPLIEQLDGFFSELTGGEPDVPIPVLEGDEDEIPEESDDSVFVVDSTGGC